MPKNVYERNQEIMQSITASDFATVLSYFGIQIVKGKEILCPFHNDKHYGSCKIAKEGTYAYCFVCNRKVCSWDIVMDKEGLNFSDALLFMWTNILGRPEPEMIKRSNRNVFLSYKELQAIGIFKPNGTGVFDLCNMQEKRSPLSKGMVSNYITDSNGYILTGRNISATSLYKMYEDEPKVVKSILYAKIEERLSDLREAKKDSYNKSSQNGKICFEYKDIAKEYREKINQDIRYVMAIKQKLKRAS